MPTKKTTTTKKAAKKPAAKKKTTNKKSLVEKKLSSALESGASTKKSDKKAKKGFPVWPLISILLLLLFAVMVLYEFNGSFKTNVNDLLKSVGVEKAADKDTDGAQDVANGGDDVAAGGPYTFPMQIVYTADDAEQKQKIDSYLANVEQNLQNTNLDVVWYDKNDAEGQSLIAKTDAKFLPIFATDERVKDHPQYAEFSPALTPVDDVLVIMSEGLEYLQTPPTEGARVIGADVASADVVLIEYQSLSCGFCKQMHPIFKDAVAKYPGQVAWVVKNFDRGGPDVELAQATECAGDQGKYEEMVDAIYDAQADVFTALQDQEDPDAALGAVIDQAAVAAGVNTSTLATCMDADTYVDLIAAQSLEGREFGVLGTPSYFVNDQFVPGAVSAEELDALIAEELN